MVSKLRTLLILSDICNFNKWSLLKTLRFPRQCVRNIFTTRSNEFSNYDVEEHEQVIDYKTYILGDESGRKTAEQALKKLAFNETEVKRILSKYPVLLDSAVNLSTNAEILLKNGFSPDILRKYPCVLSYTTESLTDRVNLLLKLNLRDINITEPFLELPMDQLKKICMAAECDKSTQLGEHRISYFVSRLQCDGKSVCEMFVKFDFLISRPYKYLQEMLDMLLEYNVHPENIVRDPWIFTYRPSIIKERLELIKETDYIEVKPWLLRCSVSRFRKTLKTYVQNRELRGNSTTLEFLAKRLNISLESAQVICIKYRPILNMNIIKLDEMFTLLYEEGFTSEQIQYAPRILCHGLKKVKHRLQELRDLGYNVTNLLVLCKSTHEYAEFLQKLTKDGSEEE